MRQPDGNYRVREVILVRRDGYTVFKNRSPALVQKIFHFANRGYNFVQIFPGHIFSLLSYPPKAPRIPPLFIPAAVLLCDALVMGNKKASRRGRPARRSLISMLSPRVPPVGFIRFCVS
jgi:hypothetical protein